MLSLISWLIIGPQSRYGGNAYLTFFLFVIFFINYEKNIKILNKSFFNYIFIFALVFFIGKNFNRYFKEYKTISSNYNFPFSSYEKISYTSLKYDYYNLQIANHDLGCGVAKFPCIVKDYEYAVTSADKKGGYLFLKSDDKILIKNIKHEHYKLNFLWNNG